MTKDCVDRYVVHKGVAVKSKEVLAWYFLQASKREYVSATIFLMENGEYMSLMYFKSKRNGTSTVAYMINCQSRIRYLIAACDEYRAKDLRAGYTDDGQYIKYRNVLLSIKNKLKGENNETVSSKSA